MLRPPPTRGRRFARLALALAVATLGLALVPLPYYLIGPGTAVDLSRAIAVAGHSPPRDRYFLTDVTLQHATVLAMAAAVLPGVTVVKERSVVPSGISAPVYQSILTDYMGESQDVAAVVAERAVGYRIAVASHVVVAAIVAQAPAARMLHRGDEIVAVGGRPIRVATEVARSIEHVAAGASVPVDVMRGASALHFDVPTLPARDKTKFGIVVVTRYRKPALPIPVRFSIGNVSGSSGGLMFALDIYRSLRPAGHGGARIAGTGTLDYGGKVGAIEGASQKLIAAKRAGASVFLVPRENYADVAKEREVRVIPVRSFEEALRALAS